MVYKWNRNYEEIECKTCHKIKEFPVWRKAKFCSHKCANLRDNSGRYFKGRIRPKEEIEKSRKKMIGQKRDPSVGIKISNSNMGMPNPKARFNPQIYKKGRKIPKDELKKILGKQGKSSLEIKFENIIKQLGLPYKFVGNGEVMVARKVPDFVDSNGKKIAIEVFYRRHKEQFRGGLEIWKAERARIFQENGWKIIFFNETEVTSDKILNKLIGGK